jgi:cytochrome P450
MEKWINFNSPLKDMPTSVVNAGREEHGALRRQLAYGFSDRSLRDQQPLIKKYIDLLIQRVREHGANGETPVDISAWYNYTTFDVIGDLAFGEAFGCLENSTYHPWVRAIFHMARLGTLFQVASHYPLAKRVMMAMAPAKAKDLRESHIAFSKAKLLKRMELGVVRPDLIEGLLNKKAELISGVLTAAGSMALLTQCRSST